MPDGDYNSVVIDSVAGSSYAGTAYGFANDQGQHNFTSGGLIVSAAKTVIFDELVGSVTGATVWPRYIEPEIVTSNGKAIGRSDTQLLDTYWDGTQLYDLPMFATGLNESGNLIGIGNWHADFNRDDPQGMVWKDGAATKMQNLIPDEYAAQIKNFWPYFISNADQSGMCQSCAGQTFLIQTQTGGRKTTASSSSLFRAGNMSRRASLSFRF